MATGHIWIYGIIGTPPKGTSDKYYSFNDFQKDLDPAADEYVVHIYSPGGDVFQGQAIYNGLKNTGKKIKVQIEGVCASIATLIAGAGDEIVMNESSQFMIHNPRFDGISGDANQLRTGAEQLDQIKSLLISVYRKRTGLSEQELWQMYDKETWMLPDKAKDLGFVDEVVPSQRAVAYADFNFIKMENKNEILSAIEMLGKKITNFFKPKNMTDTLADGTVIQVESEDGDWTGKRITREDGSPLEPGEYALADGRVLIVGDDSTISEVREMEAENNAENKEDDMELKSKLEAAEARIKELESALEARNEVAEQAEARAKSAENMATVKVKNLEEELNKIKTMTAGSKAPPKMATDAPVASGDQPLDPMRAWYKQRIFDVRNTD